MKPGHLILLAIVVIVIYVLYKNVKGGLNGGGKQKGPTGQTGA